MENVKKKGVKTQVKFCNKDYNVNPKKKTVACILECSMQLDKHPAWYDLSEKMYSKRFAYVDYTGNFKVVGIAKCDELDQFDVELGKKIAEARAKKKALSIASRVYQQIAHYLTDCATLLIPSIEVCNKAVEIEDVYIQKLIGHDNLIK
jgi:activator of HSP90 ATPase